MISGVGDAQRLGHSCSILHFPAFQCDLEIGMAHGSSLSPEWGAAILLGGDIGARRGILGSHHPLAPVGSLPRMRRTWIRGDQSRGVFADHLTATDAAL
jgi:hypothetical protein